MHASSIDRFLLCVPFGSHGQSQRLTIHLKYPTLWRLQLPLVQSNLKLVAARKDVRPSIKSFHGSYKCQIILCTVSIIFN